MVRFPGGRVEIGTDDRSAAYDNERPAHAVEVAPFWIDAHPVTNQDFLVFIARRRLRDAGVLVGGGLAVAHGGGRDRAQVLALRVTASGLRGAWTGAGRWIRAHPVCHVCWYEAEAFARFAGKRLPTEIEWEAAASWDPAHRHQPRLSLGRCAARSHARQRGPTRVRHRAGRQLSGERLADRLLTA